MVHITITPGRIAARGHASDSAGCAAVSALLYALAGGLENIGQARRWRIGGGDADIEIPGTQEAQLLRQMAEVGLRQIAAVREDICIMDGATSADMLRYHKTRRAGETAGGSLCEF